MNNQQICPLTLLRKSFDDKAIDSFIIPSGDEFQNEFVPEHSKRLQYITKFKGSSGTAIILRNKAALFVDGRYILQAKKEVDNTLFEIFNTEDLLPWQWLKKNQDLNSVLGFDSWLHTESDINRYRDHNLNLKAISGNLVDNIWPDRPDPKDSRIFIHKDKYSGQSSENKRKLIIKKITSLDADLFIITNPSSISWLLNIRGNYIENTPLVLCYAIIFKNGFLKLFIEANNISEEIKKWLGEKTEICSLKSLPQIFKTLKDKKIILDKSNACFWFSSNLQKSVIINKKDLCAIYKACKNKTEIQNACYAQLLDRNAIVKFLKWLDNNVNKIEMTELSIEKKLLEFRKENKEFIEPSFNTICGFNSNGAIIHYQASEKTNKKVEGNGLLLIDSGAQYLYGTTDITRTIVIGNVTDEQITNYTLVLKGHIALATAIFPKGTKGIQLDILARQFLWNNMLDYQHGTGHGVGSFLGVHEGPQSIGKSLIDQELLPGMILSNEPGYYKEGEYGIRIENLMLVKEIKNNTSNNKKFYCFETITKVPIDVRAVNKNLLSEKEIKWLEEYNSFTY